MGAIDQSRRQAATGSTHLCNPNANAVDWESSDGELAMAVKHSCGNPKLLAIGVACSVPYTDVALDS